VTQGLAKPNFFIVGAPKSGTTALYSYLARHPEVSMCREKEPCFLAPDFNAHAYPSTETEYLELFRDCEGAKRVGEATTTYLYSKTAAKQIKAFAPDAQIIAILRNPVDMIYALYGQRVIEGSENIWTFEEALQAEADRKCGRRIPRGFPYPHEYLLYREFGKYAAQLERYYAEFDARQVHVVLFDDFVSETRKAYANICEFLGVKTNFAPNFVPVNSARTPRFPRTNRVLKNLSRRIPASLRRAAKGVLSERSRKGLHRLYNKVTRLCETNGRPPCTPELRAELTEYFADEVRKLETILGRDLRCWRVTDGSGGRVP
jgi:hypothetical protein